MLSLKTNASLISISLKRQNQNETMRIKATDNNEGKKKKKGDARWIWKQDPVKKNETQITKRIVKITAKYKWNRKTKEGGRPVY